MYTLKIISLNVRGLNSPVKRRGIIQNLRNSDCDICLLQETHLLKKDWHRMRTRYFTKQYYSSLNTKTAGVAILISPKFKGITEDTVLDIPGRLLALRLKYNEQVYVVGSFYGPNIGQDQFLRESVGRLLALSGAEVILGGDFNIVPNMLLDRTTHRKGQMGAMSISTTQWLTEVGMMDIWRILHPNVSDYTYMSASHHTYARIDYFLISTQVRGAVREADIGTIAISDHAPITISIEIPSEKGGRGQWRMNDSLLKLDSSSSKIKEAFVDYLKFNDTSDTPVALLWDAMKAVIRGTCMGISAGLNKDRRAKREELTNSVKEMEREHKNTGARRNYRALQAKRKELKALDWDVAEYALLRTKQRYHVGGNRAGRLLAQKLRAQTAQRHISEIKSKTGPMVYTDSEIGEEFRAYYADLYTTDEINQAEIHRYLGKVNLPTLTQKEIETLEADIRIEEVISAINRTKLNKAPGPDGFTAAFYKQYCNILAPILTRLFRSLTDGGKYPGSMNEAVITVLPKPGRDPAFCSSYRPISLLNVDAKLFTSILAIRLKPFMQGLIDPDQTGFIPERGCADNTKRVLHLMDKAARMKASAVMISIDAEKAFDRVHWQYLRAVLTRFGIGPRFQQMIWSGYETPVAKVRVNGVASKPFSIQRGTRQGCPLSPLLYAMYMEPLAETIRQNAAIKGISFARTEHKLALYADDVILMLSNPEHSIKAFIETAQDFKNVSGFQINMQKSRILDLKPGNPAYETRKEHAMLPIAKEWVPYLGLRLYHTPEKTGAGNYKLLCSQVSNDLSSWKKGGLSWLGRIEAIKMTTLPRVLYIMQTLPIQPPVGCVRQLQQMIAHFIWEGKRPRMARTLTSRTAKEGGLGIPNLQNYYIAAQLRYMVEWHRPASEKHWCFMDQSVGGMHIWKVPWLHRKHRPWGAYSSPVVKSLMRAWDSVATVKKLTTFPSPYTPIIGNPEFPIALAGDEFREWQTQGCKRLGDLFDITGLKSFTQIRQQYDISEKEQWHYMHIRHWAQQTHVIKEAGRPFTEFEKWLTYKESDKHLLADIYKILNNTNQLPKSTARVRWEQELEREISDKEWMDAVTRARTATYSTAGRETAMKILHYWYYTPERILKWNRASGGKCWRGCGNTGSLIHLLWSCPKLTRFWKEVLDAVDSMFEVVLPRFPEYIVLGMPDRLAFPLHSIKGQAMAAGLLAARQAIIALWGKPDAPHSSLWVYRLWDLLGMERISASLTNTYARFLKIWRWVLTYLSTEFVEVTCPRYLRVLHISLGDQAV